MQGRVCRDDADQGDVWKVVTLHDHLGSHEDVDGTGLDLFQDSLVGMLSRRGVAVHPGDAGRGTEDPDFLFQSLGPRSHTLESMTFASRAVTGSGDLVVAIMTLEEACLEMVGQRDTAVGTLERQAAVRAQDEVGEPPTVEKEKALFFLVDIFVKGGSESLRKETFLLPHIQDLDVGERLASHPLGEGQKPELPGTGVLV